MSHHQPSDLELQVLSVLWERGPSTVREVLGALPDEKERAYTTVLTILQGMERKQFVSHESVGQAYVYLPLVERDEVTKPLMKTLLKNVFSGDPSAVIQSLLESTSVDEADLKEIRQIINRAARKQREERDA